MSDLINGLSNNYLSTEYKQNGAELKDKISNTDYSTASDEELMEACKSFEAYFVEQAFKGMEKMVPKNDEDEGSGMNHVDMFKDNLYREYATAATEQGEGLGIAKMLYEQMKRNYDI